MRRRSLTSTLAAAVMLLAMLGASLIAAHVDPWQGNAVTDSQAQASAAASSKIGSVWVKANCPICAATPVSLPAPDIVPVILPAETPMVPIGPYRTALLPWPQAPPVPGLCATAFSARGPPAIA